MEKASSRGWTVLVCKGTGCLSGSSDAIYQALKQQVESAGLADIKVDFTGCHGFCQRGPIVDIEPDGYFYTQVKIEDVPEIVHSHLANGHPIERLFYHDPITDEAIPYYRDIPFYARQQRIILRHCGHINPERIEDYLAVDGYTALRKALFEMTPEQIIDEIKRSGLRGRGGAGFSTGQKWEFCRRSPGREKYLICNADEGDPGAFMDRSILEADPHAVVEGMIIAAYAIGAAQGYVYCRAEKPLAIHRLRIALRQAAEHGFVGENILGSNFSFNIEVREGAGAFVCGEETALMMSIEGERGMPRPRPPFPAISGLWGKPTNINNVKSYATVPVIINQGADWYSSIGTKTSKGTAVFALVGKTRNCGLIEVPMGISLGEIIFDLGGGIIGGKQFRAVLTGGPSGGALPASLLELPVDYESLTQAGSIMGSGGMVVADEDTCMVDLAKFFLSFIQAESCGKCVPCRVGTQQMLNILERITGGEGQPEDIARLERLAQTVKNGSLCGLGQTAPNPVLTTIRYFREEYEEHINKHYCRAAVCKKLVESPCQNTCPARIDIPRYVRLLAEDKPAEAVAVIREKVPFPGVLGYVCMHFCESKCRRGQLDDPIAIKELKCFAFEHDSGLWKQNPKKLPPTGKKVAVIGSGPAGLTAAYYLAKLAHQVTVLEALPAVGGMMRVGIPEYRLPRDMLDKEIEEIKGAGVEIRANSRVESLDELFAQGYSAVFVGVGAHRGMNMGAEGEDTAGVVGGTEFLKEVNLGEKVKVGDRVVVVGGGNVAFDAARTALRLGAKKVTIAYRRTRAEMPASAEEIEEALKEGVNIVFLAVPLKVERKDGKLKVEIRRMELGKVDETGRRRPIPVKGSEFTEDYDLMIKAIGEQSEVPAKYMLKVGRGGRIEVDADTMLTSRQGVYAGGDVVSGPASVIEAIAAGRQAAISIDKYLGGKGDITEALAPAEETTPARNIEEVEGEKCRLPVSMLPVNKRKGNFARVELGFSKAHACEEAKRCLWCDLEEH